MRQIQKHIAAIMTGMALFAGGVGSNIILPTKPPFQSIIQPANIIHAATPYKHNSLALVTDDSSSVLSKDDMQIMQDEEQKIHQSGEATVNYDFYTYIYDDSNVNAKAKAKKIVDDYVQKGSSVPFIFVLNKADKSYHFIEDTKLAPYTSSAYLSNLAEKTFHDGVSATGVKEFAIRADSTIFMSVNGDFAFTGQMPINDKETKAHVDIVNFASKTATADDKQEKKAENKETDNEEKSESAIPAVLGFVLAVGTIGWFLKKKRAGK